MTKLLAVLAILGVVATGAGIKTLGNDYEITMVLPNANNLFVGGSVVRDGYDAGSIKDIKVVDGKARVRVKLDGSFGQLHDGATAHVVWKAVLGERLLRIDDGPKSNAVLPSGAMLTGVQAEPVEIDQVLAALDPQTRAKLNSLVANLDNTMHGRETEVNATLKSAGPALQAVGSFLDGLGTDSEAIKQLITQLNDMMSVLASRDTSVSSIVNNLTVATATAARQREALRTTLHRLPEVISTTRSTLGLVPGTVDATVPLLNDLDPATRHLTSVAKNLNPLLADLRPTVTQLRPTLDSASQLLQFTPGLLDSGTSTLPSVGVASRSFAPVLDFLRPYTPEVAGWASNWGSAAGNYDANGHYTRFLIQTGAEAPIGVTAKAGPGVTQDLTPLPGQPVGQPWTDAYGSEMR